MQRGTSQQMHTCKRAHHNRCTHAKGHITTDTQEKGAMAGEDHLGKGTASQRGRWVDIIKVHYIHVWRPNVLIINIF